MVGHRHHGRHQADLTTAGPAIPTLAAAQGGLDSARSGWLTAPTRFAFQWSASFAILPDTRPSSLRRGRDSRSNSKNPASLQTNGLPFACTLASTLLKCTGQMRVFSFLCCVSPGRRLRDPRPSTAIAVTISYALHRDCPLRRSLLSPALSASPPTTASGARSCQRAGALLRRPARCLRTERAGVAKRRRCYRSAPFDMGRRYAPASKVCPCRKSNGCSRLGARDASFHFAKGAPLPPFSEPPPSGARRPRCARKVPVLHGRPVGAVRFPSCQTSDNSAS